MSQRSTTKLFVGNIKEDCRSSDLRLLFEKYGEVAECDVVKDFAFVHFYSQDEAMAALEGLDGAEFQGITLRVQMSHSKVRPKAGMGEKESCFRCGKDGHWAKDCRYAEGRGGPPPPRGGYRDHPDGYHGGPPGAGRDFYPPHPPAGPPVPDRYHPYDRRHPGPPPEYARPPADYPWPADYYAARPDYPGRDYPDHHRRADHADTQRDPPGTDELGRPPPEYYAHRLKDALFELVKDPSRIPLWMRETERQPTSRPPHGDHY